MRIGTWLKKNTYSLAGKKIAVTGSTGGIGKELCAYLADLGATLVLLDRNKQRSEAHKNSLIARYSINVTCLPLNLEDIHAADAVTKALMDAEIDVFIHNAGAYSIPRHFCETGYENVFQINFATPYYMIRKLLPTLAERGGRAVVHPGITFTNITAHYPKLIFAVIKHPMKVIFMKPRRAALSILRGVFAGTEYGTWIGPWLFDVWGMPKKRKLRDCKEEERRAIGKIAEEVYRRCETTVAECKQ